MLQFRKHLNSSPAPAQGVSQARPTPAAAPPQAPDSPPQSAPPAEPAISDQHQPTGAHTHTLQQVSAALEQADPALLQQRAQQAAQAGISAGLELPSPPSAPEQRLLAAPLPNLPDSFSESLEQIRKKAGSGHFRDCEIALNQLETILSRGNSQAQKRQACALKVEILNSLQPQTESHRQQLMGAELGQIAFLGKAVLSAEQVGEAQTQELKTFQSKHQATLERRVVETHIQVQTLQIKAKGLEARLKAHIAVDNLNTLEQTLNQQEIQLAELLSAPPSPENRQKLEALLARIQSGRQLLREQLAEMASPEQVPVELKQSLKEYIQLREEQLELKLQKNRLDLLKNLKISPQNAAFLTGPDYRFLEPALALRPNLAQPQQEIMELFGRDPLLAQLVHTPQADREAPGLIDLEASLTPLLQQVKTPNQAAKVFYDLLQKSGRDSDLYWSLESTPLPLLKTELQACLPNALKNQADQTVEQMLASLKSVYPDRFVDKSLQFAGLTYSQSAEVGTGGNGIVLRFFEPATEKSPERSLVVKFLRTGMGADLEKLQKQFRQEMQAHRQMQKFAPAQVLPLHGLIRRGDSVGLVLDYADRGNLSSVLSKYLQPAGLQDEQGNPLLSPAAEQLLRHYLALQVIRLAEQMQNRSQLKHLDLKEDNLLVTSQGQILLADFGTAERDHTPQTASHTGTAPYMAPETTVLSSQAPYQYNHKADQWSVGIILQNLLGLHARPYQPNQYQPEYATGKWGLNKNNRVMPQAGKKPDPQAKSFAAETAEVQLFNALMHPDPAQRPSFQAIQGMRLFEAARRQEATLQELFTLLLNPPQHAAAASHPEPSLQNWYAAVRTLSQQLDTVS